MPWMYARKFLNGHLKEEIYMKVPEGIIYEGDMVCKLNKSLYGLKQSARCWFEEFDKVLKGLNFVESKIDPCIYIQSGNSIKDSVYILLYVDDLLIVTGNDQKLADIKNKLKNRFEMVDLKEIKLFLGMRIIRRDNSISMDQSSYILNILNKFQMTNCKPAATPIDEKVDHIAMKVDDDQCNAPIRSAIGCLMYLMLCTRPDLCYAVNTLSQYSNKQNSTLWTNIKRVLRYLKGTVNLKLIYEKDESADVLTGFSDSDWGGQEGTDRRSTTGFVFKLYGKAITWNTKRQKTVAASSTEAEYMALYESVREAMYLRQFCQSMHVDILDPITIYEDNQGCISIANNATCNKRTKHIDVKYHLIRERIVANEIVVSYIPTEHQDADSFTKALPRIKFQSAVAQCGLKERVE